MKEVKAYQCSECKKVYATEVEAQRCEDRCLDKCTYSIRVRGYDGGFIDLEFNYDHWEEIASNEDKYLIDVVGHGGVSFDEKGLDNLIEGIKDIKRAWVFHKANKLAEKF